MPTTAALLPLSDIAGRPPQRVAATEPSALSLARRDRCADGNGEPLMPLAEAFTAILDHARPMNGSETLAPAAAHGRIAAAPIRSAVALPPFDQSAMDGYGFADLAAAAERPARIVTRVEAGSAGPACIAAGEAVRLFTGAPVPAGVAAVAPEEICTVRGGRVATTEPILPGANIRRRGEDIAPRDILVEAGTMLDARHVALLTAVGCSAAGVFRRLRVTVISTGSELCPAGRALPPGGIYDCNRPMLLSLLRQGWIDATDGGSCPDQPHRLAQAMADGAARADLIISTGGASGSETDHVADAIRLAGGSAERLSIAVKPGKALVVGSIGSTIVLGLPGNPLAAMVGFLLFGRPLAQACVGVTPSWPRGEAAIAARPIRHSPGRTEFVPARIVATPVQGPLLVESCGAGSARLLPLVNADGLVEIEPECDGVAKGSAVIFHPFHAELAL